MKKISIDLESYSDIDIGSCGVYRYVDSPNFEILLFAYSEDDKPVEVIDLSAGEQIPEQILNALSDDKVEKWAYNASFERVCLSKFLGMPTGQYLNPKGWYCSLTWGAYLGLPLGLAKIGEVLHLAKQKLGEGKKLIKFFCVPEKDGSRNLPRNYPDEWHQFKAYNLRDVETEQEIQQHLKGNEVPASVWEEYWIDQEINDRGVKIDLTLADSAVKISEVVGAKLAARLKELTDVVNPNSPAQLTQWLCDRGITPESLGKKDVAQLIKGTDDPIVREVLQLRLMAAKSSIKKYVAMLRATCSDGRARGMFQFYGGSRTGRWAGRILQLQNLPQNHLENLGLIRAVARRGDAQEVGMLYDSVADVLSQLIRTAFVARDGTRFVVADFSAIEARVIAWLAGEQWRMNAFAEGKDIYCASASAMFGVPVVKHGINGELRQKGKVAELACIAEGQLVLTNHGEKTIETVATDDLVWDGEQWVAHEGVIYRGIKEVMTYEGLTATPDHLVYVEGQSEPVEFGDAASSSSRLIQTGDRGAALWLGEDHISREKMERKIQPLLRADRMHRMPCETMDRTEQSNLGQVKRMPELLTAEGSTIMAGEKTDGSQTEVHESERLQLQKLWRQRDRVQVQVGHGSGSLHFREHRHTRQRSRIRPYKYQWPLRSGESSLCLAQREPSEQALNRSESLGTEILAIQLQRSNTQAETRVDQTADYIGRPECGSRKKEMLEANPGKTRVYDIRNAGPHHRYTVSGKLVHNCGFGGGAGALKAMGAADMGLSDAEINEIVIKWREASPHIVDLWRGVNDAAMTALTSGHSELKLADWNRARANEEITGATFGKFSDRLIDQRHLISFKHKNNVLSIRLPSGRSLYYQNAHVGLNRFGSESIIYDGITANKTWGHLETYGGKLVENIVQAIARDLLCNAMRKLKGLRICMHIHDEVVIEADESVKLDEVCKKMAEVPEWAEGLILNADGYETPFYRKD